MFNELVQVGYTDSQIGRASGWNAPAMCELQTARSEGAGIAAGMAVKFRRIAIRVVLASTLWGLGFLDLETVRAQDPELARGPYLQSVTTQSVLTCWETDIPGNSQVDYGLTDAYGMSVIDTTFPITNHVVMLTDLEPYTTYHYRIVTDGHILSQDYTFKTAATIAQTSFSFAAFGDTRTNHEDHLSVINSMVNISPDFYLHTGDLVAEGSDREQWNSFFEIESEMMAQSPLFPSLGNHERSHPNYFELFHLPGNERWYSFDYGNAHFTILQVDGYADFQVGSEQYNWLENDLSSTTQLWKFVVFHIPPYSTGRHGSNLSVRETLSPLFESNGVQIVFTGHDHDYERSIANGVVYIVSGGGGAPLYLQEGSSEWSVYFESTLHFFLASIDGDMLDAVVIRPNGSRFDAFQMDSSGAIWRCSYLPIVLSNYNNVSLSRLVSLFGRASR